MQGLTELLLLPLVGAVTIGVFKSVVPQRFAGIWASVLLVASFALAVLADIHLAGLPAGHREISGTLFNWVTGFGPKIGWNVYLDPLSGIWLLVITGVGALIHIYSNGYMHDDPDRGRFGPH